MDATNDSSSNCFSPSTCRLAAFCPRYDRHLFDFEKNFDECGIFEWFQVNWKICYYFISAYLVAIFAGRHLMKSRAPYQLHTALVSWNVAMAAFSIFCAWRTVSALLYQIQLDSFYHTLCSTVHSKQSHQAGSFYALLFALSKVVELGDTAFIVLRKTPLIILHWFHHATVVFFVWSCSAYPSSIHGYFMAMNFSVHAIMYSYYVLKVLKIHIPKPINMAITSLQLLQMLGGLYVTLYTYYMRAIPEVGCCVVDVANQIALAIYFAYFVLFSNFFIRSYLLKKRSVVCHVKKSD